MFEGLKRHWFILREAWRAEGERRKRKKLIDEVDFLPAALEILEKPPSPLGRTLVWLLAALFTIAIAWAVFGKVDVVATAPGRIIPRERVKVIQPAEIGVVRAIHVRDGQRVKRGEVLIELDPTISGAAEEQSRRTVLRARIAAARAEAVLAHLDGEAAQFDVPEGTPGSAVLMQKRLIASRISEYEASIASLAQSRAEREAELAVVSQQLKKLRQTLPLLEEQVEARRTLMEKGLTPRLTYLELKEKLVERRQDIAIQLDQAKKVGAAIAALDRQTEQLSQEFRKTVLTELAEAQDEIMLQGAELKKAAKRNVLQRLKAPVDGVVQQLAVHTIGGVVQPAEPLAVIVPGEGELIVEASVLNKDVGFVAEGQVVEVKLEAFPFTKYGVVPGVLEHLSPDAVQDEVLGLVYPARVRLGRDWLQVNGKRVNLGPGLAATAEIKTGKRRLIEFLISPLLRYRDESFRER